MIEIKLVK